MRLSKLMSERGICSRREADRYIEAGLVRVNGEVVDQLGTKVAPNAKVVLLPEAKRQQDEKLTIILNKPLGVVSTPSDKGYTLASSLLTPENCYDEPGRELGHLEKLGIAGRLDVDSKGLLIFSQDGTLIKQIIGPDTETEKEYLVRVEGEITFHKLKQLRYGMYLDGEALKRAQVDKLDHDFLRFVLTQGKKRQIRRMCELVGLEVCKLKRVRIGNITLGKLPEGCWQQLRWPQ